MFPADQKLSQKHCICQFVLSTERGTVNTKETLQYGCQTKYALHKISKAVKTNPWWNVSIKHSKATACARLLKKKDLKQNPGGLQSLSSLLSRSHVSHRKKNKVDVCMHRMITNVNCFVSNWLSSKEHYFKTSGKILYEWTAINFDLSQSNMSHCSCHTQLRDVWHCRRSVQWEGGGSGAGMRACRWRWRG